MIKFYVMGIDGVLKEISESEVPFNKFCYAKQFQIVNDDE